MAKCRHFTVGICYVLSKFILVFWQKHILVVNSAQNYRWQYLSRIQIVLLLLPQNHLMFGFLYFCWMTSLFFCCSWLQQFGLLFIYHFNCWRTSDLGSDFDYLGEFSLLFDHVLIYNSFLWIIHRDCILLGLFWVVIAFIGPVVSFWEIRRSSILDNVVAKHIWAATLNISVRGWSGKDIDLFVCFIAICYCYICLLVFGWNLNWMSRTLFTHRSCWSRFLLFQKRYIYSFIWLHNT